jgi:hypothetical protein
MRLRGSLQETALQETVYQPVVLLAQSLFKVSKNEKGKISALKPEMLNHENYEFIIKNYLSENEFIILTNFKEVLIFDKEALSEFQPLQSLSFADLLKESIEKDSLFAIAKSFEKPDNQEILLKNFTKTIEKFVGQKNIENWLFACYLQSYALVPYHFLSHLYFENKKLWERQGEAVVFEQFSRTISNWLALHYAFSPENSLNHSDFEKLLLSSSEKVKNLSGYNFRKINEFVLGKSFENVFGKNNDFPEEIYEALCQNLVEQLFENQISIIYKEIEKGNWKKAKQLFQILFLKAG